MTKERKLASEKLLDLLAPLWIDATDKERSDVQRIELEEALDEFVKAHIEENRPRLSYGG